MNRRAEERRVEGRAEGVERGLAEGLAARRMALKRQAALRFGVPAQVPEPLLERIDSPPRWADVSERLIVGTLDELVAKMRVAAGRAHRASRGPGHIAEYLPAALSSPQFRSLCRRRVRGLPRARPPRDGGSAL